MTRRQLAAGISLAGYASTIFAANWAIERYGFVPVGFGLEAPAGVYAAGLAFTFRDLVHEYAGKWAAFAAILAGAALSWSVSPVFAGSSAAAFLFSEVADLLVYTPLRDRGWLVAVAASNTAGLIVDSALFLWLAFGSLQFLEGQIVGKAWMTLLAVGLFWLLRRAAERRRLERAAAEFFLAGSGLDDDEFETP